MFDFDIILFTNYILTHLVDKLCPLTKPIILFKLFILKIAINHTNLNTVLSINYEFLSHFHL